MFPPAQAEDLLHLWQRTLAASVSVKFNQTFERTVVRAGLFWRESSENTANTAAPNKTID